jgi:biotin carboxyl carrier protein
MKREVRINEKKRLVEIDRRDGVWSFRVDGQAVPADVMEISPGIYSILLGGRSFEARVQPHGARLEIEVGTRRVSAEVIDPRRLVRAGHDLELEGRQEVSAPMPGKVVRVMIEQGKPVEAGQGILVLEAMKMQNEVQSPKSGMVERLLVKEGQAVNAGDTLAVVA